MPNSLYTQQRVAAGMPDTHRASKRLLIQGCSLLAADAPGQLLRDQDILIVGQHIAAVGPTDSILRAGDEPDRIISGQGYVVMPGFVNAHTHSLENLLKAMSPSLPLELWLVPLFTGAFEWSPRLAYLSVLLGAIEMLKTGTTAVLDHLWTASGVDEAYLHATMRAYRDAGIRATVAPSIEDRDLVVEAGHKRGVVFPHHPFIDRFSTWPAIDEQLHTLEHFFSTWHDTAEGRIRCLAGPSGIHWCSEKLLVSCLDLAERYQVGLHLHAVETELQATVIHEMLGQGGISYLGQLGILKPGTSLAHAIWLEDGDLERLAETNTTVVHNPVSNLRLGSGRFPLVEAWHQGVDVALGSDGSASNDTQNMFGVLKLTGLMHNQPHEEYTHWPQATEILEAATLGGAAALGLNTTLGKIAPGQLADLVILDMENAAFFPLHDPYLHLVYCEQGTSVASVIVNGEVVVEQGTIMTVDEQAVRQEIRTLLRGTWPGFGAQLNSVANTREVFSTFEALRRQILQKD